MTATLSIEEARQRLDFENTWVGYCERVAVSFAKSYSDKIEAEDLAAHLMTELFAKKDRLLVDKTPEGNTISPAYVRKAIANIAANYVEKELSEFFHYSDKYIYTNRVTRGLLSEWFANPYPAIADVEGSDARSIWAMFADVSSAFERLNEEQQRILRGHFEGGKSITGNTERRRFQAAVDRTTVLLNRGSRNDRKEYTGSRIVLTNRQALDRTRMTGPKNWKNP